MKETITKKDYRFLSLTIAGCGLLLIGSGLTMASSTPETIIKQNYSVSVTEQRIAQSRTNEIKLKTMELEINNPMSLNIKDYLEDADQIEPSILKALKEDNKSLK